MWRLLTRSTIALAGQPLTPALVAITLALGGGSLVQAADMTTALVPAGLANGDFHGGAVAVDGEWAAVGAPGYGTAGAVFLYRLQNEAWSLHQTLVPGQATAQAAFGTSVALRDRHLVVGAQDEGTAATKAGAAWIFRRSDDAVWTGTRLSLSGLGEFSRAGAAVAIGCDAVAVGIPFQSKAIVFPLSPDGVVGSGQVVLPPVVDSFASFGSAMAIAGARLAIGAPTSDQGIGLTDVGAVHLFSRDPSGVWQTDGEVTNDSPEYGEQFGRSVAMHGDTLAVGKANWSSFSTQYKKGAVLVFVNFAGTWSKQAEFTGSTTATTDLFGWSVAVQGNSLLVGAPQDDDGGSDAGAVFRFIRNGTSWSQAEVFDSSPLGAGDILGLAVAMSGDRVVVGAPQAQKFDGAAKPGKAWAGVIPDTSAPRIISVRTPLADGAYRPGTSMPILVDFSEAVTLQGGALTVALDTGATIAVTPFTGLASTLMATYVPSPGAATADLDVTALSLAGGATLADGSGNDADLTIASTARLAANRSIAITDGTLVKRVSTTLADGTYPRGAVITIAVEFTDPVTVSGTPTVALNTTPQRTAVYASGSGTGTLTFHYTVQYGDRCLDLDPDSSGSLTGGGIIGTGGMAANRLLPTGAAPTSLATNHGVVIDGIGSSALGDTTLGDDAALGSAIAMNGVWAAAGAPTAVGGGAVSVFQRTAGMWKRVAAVRPADGASGDRFGQTVALDGTTMAIGAPGRVVAGRTATGSVSIYVLTGGAWTLQTRLDVPALAAAEFGVSLALRGDDLLVTSDLDDAVVGSQRYVWHYRRSGGAWAAQGVDGRVTYLDNSTGSWLDRQMKAGRSLVFDGTTIYGGSDSTFSSLQLQTDRTWVPDYDNTFVLNGQVRIDEAINPTDVNGFTAEGIRFGSVITATPGMAWVAAPYTEANTTAYESGSVYHFTRLGRLWTQSARLVPGDTHKDMRFGSALAFDGANLIIGAPRRINELNEDVGAFYLFALDRVAWKQKALVTPVQLHAQDGFASTVAVSEGWVAVGAPGSDQIAQDGGAVYFFDLAGAVEPPSTGNQGPSLITPATASTTIMVMP